MTIVRISAFSPTRRYSCEWKDELKKPAKKIKQQRNNKYTKIESKRKETNGYVLSVCVCVLDLAEC